MVPPHLWLAPHAPLIVIKASLEGRRKNLISFLLLWCSTLHSSPSMHLDESSHHTSNHNQGLERRHHCSSTAYCCIASRGAIRVALRAVSGPSKGRKANPS
jgi:hypothetical protein